MVRCRKIIPKTMARGAAQDAYLVLKTGRRCGRVGQQVSTGIRNACIRKPRVRLQEDASYLGYYYSAREAHLSSLALTRFRYPKIYLSFSLHAKDRSDYRHIRDFNGSSTWIGELKAVCLTRLQSLLQPHLNGSASGQSPSSPGHSLGYTGSAHKWRLPTNNEPGFQQTQPSVAT